MRRTAEAIARRIEARHAVRWRWQGDAMELVAPAGIASGARGRLTVGDGDVTIEVHLPLALSPLRGMIERQLVARLDRVLADADTSNGAILGGHLV